jgi:hypothetical protein
MTAPVDLAALRLKLLAGRDLTADDRQVLLRYLPNETYTLREVGPSVWQVVAPGYRPVTFRSERLGLRYLVVLVERAPAGEQVAVLDPDAKSPRQAVDRAIRCAIVEIERHCPPLADLLLRALTVGKVVARLLLPPSAVIKTGNAAATSSHGPD